jgi:hypothetical protein
MNISPLMRRIWHWISTSVQHLAPQISTLALIISFGALIVSTLQYFVVRKHHRLSVRPHVVITFTLEGGTGEKNGIYLANPGLGPAIMKALSVEVGATSYDAMDKRVWRRVFRDLALVPGCFRQGWARPGNALKAGEELPLLTITHANPPVVDGQPCPIELLKFLKAEGLKIRMQYESMYGEPYEAVGESWVDDQTIADVAMAGLQQQVMPKMVEQLKGMVPQLQLIADRLQQMQDKAMKHMPGLAGQMLLHELYEDPPGAPWNWWLQKRDYSINPHD